MLRRVSAFLVFYFILTPLALLLRILRLVRGSGDRKPASYWMPADARPNTLREMRSQS